MAIKGILTREVEFSNDVIAKNYTTGSSVTVAEADGLGYVLRDETGLEAVVDTSAVMLDNDSIESTIKDLDRAMTQLGY
jgi:hypothetical protein